MCLPTRTLGKNGPQVSSLGFGAMGLSAGYGAVGSDEERLEFLTEVYNRGERFWDSADVYGDSEELIGKWFARTGKRNDIFLATKFAVQLDFSSGAPVMTYNSDPEYVKEACEKSLKRSGVSQIDLYYCHRVDGKTPIEKTVQAMAELKQQGKIKYLGLSECSAETLRRAHAICPITAVQIEYSPFTMDIEDPQIGLLKTCRELGVATIAYSPLGRGFVTGQLRSLDDLEATDVRRYMPRFSPENFPRNLVLVDELKAMADRKGCTVSQLVLAWMMAQGDDIIPIPGTKKVKYLEENIGSLKVRITPEENKEIRKAVASAEVHGHRSFTIQALFADTPPLE